MARKKRNPIKIVVSVVFLAIVATMILVAKMQSGGKGGGMPGRGGRGGGAGQTVFSVKTMKAEVSVLHDYVATNGEVEAQSSIEVFPDMGGKIRNVYVSLGSPVKKGSVIARVDAPITLHEASMYKGKMDTYGTEDFLQEGNIVAWEIISRHNFKGGKFSTYFTAAVRNHLIRIFRDYNLKNLVCIDESEDYYGNIIRILVESDYAKEYRKKKAEQNKRWYVCQGYALHARFYRRGGYAVGFRCY